MSTPRVPEPMPEVAALRKKVAELNRSNAAHRREHHAALARAERAADENGRLQADLDAALLVLVEVGKRLQSVMDTVTADCSAEYTRAAERTRTILAEREATRLRRP